MGCLSYEANVYLDLYPHNCVNIYPLIDLPFVTDLFDWFSLEFRTGVHLSFFSSI